MENKSESLLVSLGKTHNGMPPSICSRYVARPSSLHVSRLTSKKGWEEAYNLRCFYKDERSCPYEEKEAVLQQKVLVLSSTLANNLMNLKLITVLLMEYCWVSTFQHSIFVSFWRNETWHSKSLYAKQQHY